MLFFFLRELWNLINRLVRVLENRFISTKVQPCVVPVSCIADKIVELRPQIIGWRIFHATRDKCLGSKTLIIHSRAFTNQHFHNIKLAFSIHGC